MDRIEAIEVIVDMSSKSRNFLNTTNDKWLSLNDPIFLKPATHVFSDFGFLAEHAFWIENRDDLYRLWYYHAALAQHARAGLGNGIGSYLETLADAFAPLMSDNSSMIEKMQEWKCAYGQVKVESRGSLFLVAQALMRNEKEKAQELMDRSSKYLNRKIHFQVEEREAMQAIIEENDDHLKSSLYQMLRPELHKKTLDPVYVGGYFYSYLVLTYIKFARYLGMEIEIDHELVPKELAAFKPLDKYEIQYDFMKAVKV